MLMLGVGIELGIEFYLHALLIWHSQTFTNYCCTDRKVSRTTFGLLNNNNHVFRRGRLVTDGLFVFKPCVGLTYSSKLLRLHSATS